MSTRRYARSLDPLPADVEERATSKSAVSRRFVTCRATLLAEWLARPPKPARTARFCAMRARPVAQATCEASALFR